LNIYLNDGDNPNRVLNTMFSNVVYDIKRDRNYIYHSGNQIETTIDNLTRQFLTIKEHPDANLSAVEEGGKLPVGNLFFYIRYLDYEFNTTNFVPLLGPVMITHGDDTFSISGNVPSENINFSNKRSL